MVDASSDFSDERFHQTYSAAIVNLAVAANPTDIFTITGSASKIIRILYASVIATRTNSGNFELVALKRSTANSGGTSTSVTAVPHDSNFPAATATALAYTANPTLGTLVGNLSCDKPFAPSSTNNDGGELSEFIFAEQGGAQIVLRNTSQVFAINLNATSVAGGTFSITVRWTEE